MTSDTIEKIVVPTLKKGNALNIHFKDRRTVNGIFIRGNDFDELKAKNFWRIVNILHKAEWEATQNPELARLFNGAAFTRLS